MCVFYWLLHVLHTLEWPVFPWLQGGCVQPLGQDLTKAPEMDAVSAWYVRWHVLGVVRDCIAIENMHTPEVVYTALQRRKCSDDQKKIRAISGGNELQRERNCAMLLLMVV